MQQEYVSGLISFGYIDLNKALCVCHNLCYLRKMQLPELSVLTDALHGVCRKYKQKASLRPFNP